MWWSEMQFTFNSGVLDRKKLIKFEMEETAEEAEEREDWEVANSKEKYFKELLGINSFLSLPRLLRKLLSWSGKRLM